MDPVNFKSRLVPVTLALLRIAIGWHFLYEGLNKIIGPAWTARPFLEGSRWIFGDLFKWMVSNDTGMWIVDTANAYGLTLIGLALILGIFSRLASWCGAAILLLYYLAYPSFGGYSYGTLSEGNYLIVNKNIVELIALLVLAFSQSGQFFGLDKLLVKKKVHNISDESEPETEPSVLENNRRREFIKGFAGLPFLAVFGGTFYKNMVEPGSDAVSGATITVNYKGVKEIKGKLPEGKLGNLKVSRMIMGCNLIGGWSHARDLIYAGTLFKAYNNDKKIIETYYLAEQAGINTNFMVTKFYPVFNKYKKLYNSNMQTVCQAMLPEKDFLSNINLAIDSGATALYIQGNEGDKYMTAGRFEEVFKAIDHIKKQGFMAGLGGHSLETIKACEREGIPVDFYVKTFHHDKYWSAHPEANRVEHSVIGPNSEDHNGYHDNMWDLFPSKTIEYMNGVKKPWIAFKVLAAGAIQPKDGFRFAFENGADFIAVGMFDFQVVDNVNTASETLLNLTGRKREWYS